MLLLDTHVLIWLGMDNSALSAAALKQLDRYANRLYFSSISILEIGQLYAKKKVKFGVDPEEMISKIVLHYNLQEIPVDREIAWASTQLKEIHSDPFDRILIATAKLYGMKLVTKDRIIPTYPGVKTIW